MYLQKNWKEFMKSTFLEMLPSPVHMLALEVTLYPLQWLTLYAEKERE